MLKTIKTSLKDSLVYGFGNIAVKLIGFILIPLYTDPKYFTVDDFGVLGLLEISALVLTALMASSLPQILTRYYWDKDHRENQKGIFFMTLIVQIAVSLVICSALIPLSGTFSNILFSKTDWSQVVTLVILSSGLQSLNNIVNTLMRLQSRSVLYTVANLFKLGMVLLLTILFIIRFRMGLEGIYLAQVFGNIFFLAVLSSYTFRNSRIYFEWNLIRQMNAYGYPLLIANIAAAMLTVIDRYSLNSMAVLKSVALYTLAFKITSVLKLVVADSIKLAISPVMFKWMDRPDNKRFYSKVLLYSSYVLMFSVVGISLFSYELIKVMTNSTQFWSAAAIIPVLGLSVFFGNMKDIVVYGLHFEKKTGIISIIIIITTLLSLGLNILLIPLLDLTGAALATLISQIIFWLLCNHFSQKAFFVPYEYFKLAILFITGTILSFISLKLNTLDILPRLILKTAALLSFPFLLYPAGFYEKVEIQAIRGFAVKWLNLKNIRSNIKSIRGMIDDL
jgi:O-antigen/teichoic acid export membrane protein